MALPATTAILTYTHLLTFQCYDVNNTLTRAAVTLQTTKVTPKKSRQKIDITNSLSNGLMEFAPGLLQVTLDVAGIVDTSVAFDEVFTVAMDNPFFAQVIFYLTKPTVGGGGNSPIKYTGKFLVTEADLDWEVSSGGAVGKYTCSMFGVGPLTKAGTDLAPGAITGFVP